MHKHFLIFCLPIGLVIGRGLEGLSGDFGSSLAFLLVMVSVSIILFAGWNFYMWQQAKQLSTLTHLLDEVDKHNKIITAVNVMDKLKAIE
jgi:hypothetical protein